MNVVPLLLLLTPASSYQSVASSPSPPRLAVDAPARATPHAGRRGRGARDVRVFSGLATGARAAFLLVPQVTLTSVAGGALAGGLHAVSGPDHLAAVLPRCVGKRWWNSARIGALWAFGHGLSASLLGVFAFLVKGRLTNGRAGVTLAAVKALAAWSEVAVGGSLVVIGALGMKEARLWKAPTPSEAPLLNAGGNRAVVLNGILHGFSWDGTPSLAPALALPTLPSVLAFLLAYCGGTIVAMSCAAVLIGEGSLAVGETLHRPDLLQKLSLISSAVAFAVGVAWTARALPGLVWL